MADRKSYPDSFKDTITTAAHDIPEIEDVYNGPDIEAVYAGPDMWDEYIIKDTSPAGVIKEGAKLVKKIGENAE